MLSVSLSIKAGSPLCVPAWVHASLCEPYGPLCQELRYFSLKERSILEGGVMWLPLLGDPGVGGGQCLPCALQG